MGMVRTKHKVDLMIIQDKKLDVSAICSCQLSCMIFGLGCSVKVKR